MRSCIHCNVAKHCAYLRAIYCALCMLQVAVEVHSGTTLLVKEEAYCESVAKVEVFQRDFQLHVHVVALGCLLLFFKAPAKTSKPSKWAASTKEPVGAIGTCFALDRADAIYY